MGRDPKRPDFYAIPEGALVALRGPDVKRGGVWEAAVFEAPFVIDDQDDAFHPLGGMAVDVASRFLFNVRIFDRGTSPIQILGDILVEAMRQHGLIPESIRLIGAEQVEGLGPFALHLGIKLKKAKRLQEFESALRSMHRHVERKARQEGSL